MILIEDIIATQPTGQWWLIGIYATILILIPLIIFFIIRTIIKKRRGK